MTSLQKFNQQLNDDCEPVSGTRQLGWASCGTLASETTFCHVNTLARLTRTTLSVLRVTWCLDLGFKAEICIKEVKFNSAKPTVIE